MIGIGLSGRRSQIVQESHLRVQSPYPPDVVVDRLLNLSGVIMGGPNSDRVLCVRRTGHPQGVLVYYEQNGNMLKTVCEVSLEKDLGGALVELEFGLPRYVRVGFYIFVAAAIAVPIEGVIYGLMTGTSLLLAVSSSAILTLMEAAGGLVGWEIVRAVLRRERAWSQSLRRVILRCIQVSE